MKTVPIHDLKVFPILKTFLSLIKYVHNAGFNYALQWNIETFSPRSETRQEYLSLELLEALPVQ